MAKIPSYPALPLAELDPTTALYVVDGGRSRRLLSGTFLDWINAGLPAVGQGAFVRLDINGRLPALDGRRLTNLPSTGSGGGAVSSVNGQTGAVALTASDVGAAATGHTHAFQDLTSIPAPLSAIGALTAAADRFPYFTSSSAAALTTLTTFGRSLLDDADAAAARTTLGLGSAATYDAANLPISTAVQVALDGKASVSDLANKADTSAVTAALADKADAASVAAALADKADVSALASKADAVDLAAKADTTALTAAIATREPVTTYPTISGASTNLVASNAFARLRFTNTAPTLTIQLQSAHAYPDNFDCSGYPDNATGQMTITAPAGVTLRLYNGDSISTETSVTVGAFSLIRAASDSWRLIAGRQLSASQLAAHLTSIAGPPTAGTPNALTLTDTTWGWVRPATATEARGGTATGYRTPASDTAAAIEVDRGSVSGTVIIDPLNGPNQFFTITGPTRFAPPESGLFASSGMIRVRMGGSHAVTWDRRIGRDADAAQMAPDPRAWVDTLYSYVVLGGRMRIAPFVSEAISDASIPTVAQFSGFWEPSGARVGDAASAVSAIGDTVRTLLPSGGLWTYLDSAGATQTVAVANRNYTTAAASNLPILVDLDGYLGVRHFDGGNGLVAALSGIQQIGAPNPSGDAMPYLTTLTWGANVYLPAGGGLGPIGGVFRAETSVTGQLGLFSAASSIYGHARLASGSVRQVSSAADVTANNAVHAAELALARGRWVPAVFQARVNMIDTAADTDPPGTTVRGEGATLEIWLSDGIDGHAVVDISSYRGANGLGWRANRSVLGAIYSSSSLQDASDVTISRHFVSMDPGMVYGSSLWWQSMRWLGGRS